MNKRCRAKQCLTPKELGDPSTVPSSYVRRQPDYISSKFQQTRQEDDSHNISFEDEEDEEDMEDDGEAFHLPVTRPGDLKASLENFVEMGLEEEEGARHPRNLDWEEEKCGGDQQLHPLPVSVANLSPSKCGVAVEFWGVGSPGREGAGLVTGAECGELCLLCGAGGLEESIVRCGACCQPAHPACAGRGRGWVCPACTACSVCGDPEPALSCVECGAGAHPACLPAPARESGPAGWRCQTCLACTSCGSHSVPARADPALCAPCSRARLRGSFCAVCRGCYEEDDYDCSMMECGQCGGWIHARCEGLDGEQYQVLSYLPDTVEYTCK